MIEVPANPRAWRALEKLIDAIETGAVTVVADPDVFDAARHVYGLNAVAGLVAALVCQALGLDVPLVSVRF